MGCARRGSSAQSPVRLGRRALACCAARNAHRRCGRDQRRTFACAAAESGRRLRSGGGDPARFRSHHAAGGVGRIGPRRGDARTRRHAFRTRGCGDASAIPPQVAAQPHGDRTRGSAAVASPWHRRGAARTQPCARIAVPAARSEQGMGRPARRETPVGRRAHHDLRQSGGRGAGGGPAGPRGSGTTGKARGGGHARSRAGAARGPPPRPLEHHGRRFGRAPLVADRCRPAVPAACRDRRRRCRPCFADGAAGPPAGRWRDGARRLATAAAPGRTRAARAAQGGRLGPRRGYRGAAGPAAWPRGRLVRRGRSGAFAAGGAAPAGCHPYARLARCAGRKRRSAVRRKALGTRGRPFAGWLRGGIAPSCARGGVRPGAGRGRNCAARCHGTGGGPASLWGACAGAGARAARKPDEPRRTGNLRRTE